MVKNEKAIIQMIVDKKKALASAERKLIQIERAIALEEALITLTVCQEQENGKPKYSNELIRKAEITRRLTSYDPWQRLIQQKDRLEEEIKSLQVEIAYLEMEVSYGQKHQA